MAKYKVFLKSIVQAKNLCDMLQDFDFDIQISDGKKTADAKDVMDILTLDLSDAIVVTAFTENPASFEEKIKHFVKTP